jgi:hypothetical protein
MIGCILAYTSIQCTASDAMGQTVNPYDHERVATSPISRVELEKELAKRLSANRMQVENAPVVLLEADITTRPKVPAKTVGTHDSLRDDASRSDGTLVEGLQIKMADEQVKVSWNTPREKNVREFVLERTTDGINFTKLGTVEGGGTTHQRKHYDLIDRYPINGHVYYCLTSTDIHDEVVCWGIMEVKVNEKPQLNVWPSPAQQEDIQISINFLKDSVVRWELTNLQGNIVVHETDVPVDNGLLVLKLSDYEALPAGIYFVHVRGLRQTYTSKFVIRP